MSGRKAQWECRRALRRQLRRMKVFHRKERLRNLRRDKWWLRVCGGPEGVARAAAIACSGPMQDFLRKYDNPLRMEIEPPKEKIPPHQFILFGCGDVIQSLSLVPIINGVTR